MDFILNCPSFIKVGLVFIGILIAYRFGLALGHSIIIFAVVLTLWTGTGFKGLLYQAKALILPENYILIIVIFLLLFFTESLDKTGRMKKTIDSLKNIFKSKKLLLGGLPALIGLLPMPGGALFSAPLVDATDADKSLKPEHKTAINYWFRHVWEYWWPLYPGVILAIKYSGLTSGLFYLVQMPFTVVSIAAGYFFIIRKIKDNKHIKIEGSNYHDILQAFIPITLLVLFSLLGSFILPKAGITKTLANYYGMLAGLITGFIIIFANNHKAFFVSLNLFKKKSTWEMVFLVIGILLFSTALKIPMGDNNFTLVTDMRDEFLKIGIPLILVIALIPFISGAVTGVAFGFVGASFPIVFALIGSDAGLNTVIAATSFSYVCGYMGMILSPVHICFVVTNQYFKTNIFSSYRYFILPVLMVLLSGIIISGLYYFLIK